VLGAFVDGFMISCLLLERTRNKELGNESGNDSLRRFDEGEVLDCLSCW